MQLSPHLFWDIEPDSFKPEQHAAWIIPRVFMKGTLEDVRVVMRHYEREEIQQVLQNTRYLDKKTLALCCVVFKLQKEDFRCYRERQLNPTPWDY